MNDCKGQSIAFLSGAPRVSTRVDAAAVGPRAHVLGTIEGFQSLGWHVKSFILGDRLSHILDQQRQETSGRPNAVRQFSTDLMRLGFRQLAPRWAGRCIGRNVDFVYERFAVMQAMGRTFQKRGVPWVLETNGPFFYEAKVERESLVLTRLARSLEVRAYRECDALVCVSEELKRIVVQEAEVSPSKIIVAPNGVDTNRFNPNMPSPYRFSDRMTIGFVGSVLKWQGLDILLKALSIVLQGGIQVDLVIVGDGPELQSLKDLAGELNITSNVHFVGRVEWTEVPRYLAGFDLGFSGQRTMKIGSMYHSPLKLYEYTAMGLPILASEFKDAIFLRETGGKVFLFAAGSVEALSIKIREAYAMRYEFATWKSEIRSVALLNHTWRVRVRQMMEEIRTLLGALA